MSQVIAAFVISATLTSLLGITFVVLTFALDESGIFAPLLNRLIVRRLGQQLTTSIAAICYEMVMCMGDQQPVIALALLVAATKKLVFNQGLSVFHLHVILSLVFITSTAFTYTIIAWRVKCERELLQNDVTVSLKNEDAPEESFWKWLRARLLIAARVGLVFTVYVLLTYAGLITAKTFYIGVTCPASCYRNIKFDSSAGYWWLSIFWAYIFLTTVVAFLQVRAGYPSNFLSVGCRRIKLWLKEWHPSNPQTSLKEQNEGTEDDAGMGRRRMDQEANLLGGQVAGQTSTTSMQATSNSHVNKVWRQIEVFLCLVLVTLLFSHLNLCPGKSMGRENPVNVCEGCRR